MVPFLSAGYDKKIFETTFIAVEKEGPSTILVQYCYSIVLGSLCLYTCQVFSWSSRTVTMALAKIFRLISLIITSFRYE